MSNLDQVQICCPCCGEWIDIQVDIAGDEADYVEDCSVCCRPMLLHVVRDENGVPEVSATRESE